MWITKDKTWYSEDEVQKIEEYCQDIIDNCRAECGYNAYAGGKYDTAQQIIELLKEIKK